MPHYAKSDVISGQNKYSNRNISSTKRWGAKVQKNLYHSFKSSFAKCNKNFRFINTLMKHIPS